MLLSVAVFAMPLSLKRVALVGGRPIPFGRRTGAFTPALDRLLAERAIIDRSLEYML